MFHAFVHVGQKRGSRFGALGCVVLFFWIGLLVSGCATSTVRATGSKAGLCGQQAADAALHVYEDLRSVAKDNTYHQGYLRIVVSSEPDAVDFTKVSDADFSVQIEPRIQVYRRVRDAYLLLQQLCSGESERDAAQSYAALFETLRALSADDSASAETKKLVSELPSDLSALLRARRIARAQSALARAAADLAALWDKELPAWNDYIDAVYIGHYASGLLSLRLANFDEKELSKAVDGPYRAPVKAGLFKLQKYSEASQKADRLKEELRLVSAGFQQLLVLHRQLSDSSTPFADIHDTQRRIGRYASLAEEQPGKE